MKPKDAFGRYGCVPRDMHPAWQRVSYFARALGRDLFSQVDDFQSMSIATSGDWKSSLCLTLCVNGGNDRRNAKRALDELEAASLIAVEERRVLLFLEPRAVAQNALGMSPACARDVAAESPQSRRGVVSSTQVPETPQVTSDSKLVSKQAERVAPAPARSVASRPDIVGFNFVASLLGRDVFSIAPLGSYRDEYHWIGTRPTDERVAVAKAVAGDEWCATNPGHVDAAHLVKGWQKYLEGRPKPVARVVEKPAPTGFWAKAGAAQ